MNTNVVLSDYINQYTSLNGNKQLHIRKVDLARALISVGGVARTSWLNLLTDLRHIVNDFLHHYTGLHTYIVDSPNLAITPRFSALPASDKNLKSYNLGMGISKIVSEKIFGIKHLSHVDNLISQGVVNITQGSNIRGDLIGCDNNNNWHVFEAKCRTSKKPSRNLFAHAKNQASNIISINGNQPVTNNSCITHITTSGTTVYLNDPFDDSKKCKIDIKTGRYLNWYYGRIFSLVNYLKPIEPFQLNHMDYPYRMFDLNESFEIGILEYLFDYRSFDYELSNSFWETISDLNEDQKSPYSFGLDGIMLKVKTSNLL